MSLSDSAPAHHHDDDAVYLADDAVTCVAPGWSSPKCTAILWLALPHDGVFSAPSIMEPRSRRVRPPGTDAAWMHTLLPHVLRV